VLLDKIPVTVLSAYGRWLEVEWLADDGIHHGWVPAFWITLVEPVNPGLITPTISP
jgi:hypothetical protein